jgi:diguanylate cyclase (GGDEF)-like protein
MMLDIDKFKTVNDTYGHPVGDQVLKEVANMLRSLLRVGYDRAGRFGGEEFSLLLPQTRAVNAFRIAERVRANIAGLSITAPGADGGERVQVTVSVGVAALDGGRRRELSELVAAADAALYRAKAWRPGSGADDQHDQGPERSQRRPRGYAERIPPGPGLLISEMAALSSTSTRSGHRDPDPGEIHVDAVPGGLVTGSACH